MLQSHQFSKDGLICHHYTTVVWAENFPDLLHFWMAHIARDALRLGAFLHAAALLRELPGGAWYRALSYDPAECGGLTDEDRPHRWLARVSRRAVLNVLAECVQRLRAPRFMKRIPGGADHRPDDLSEEWTAYLDRHAEVKNGLLNVVAACLDELIVEPGLEEIDAPPHTTWWQEWWARMNE